jgi:hypothetical protein
MIGHKPFIEIASPDSDIALESAGHEDIGLLRDWKNANRGYFFYNKIITPGQQEDWFRDYMQRQDDYIFMVVHNGIKIGCMGFRLTGGRIDIYNVILGQEEFGKKGLMSIALKLMCSYLIDSFDKEIGLKVLKKNLARRWYGKNGFSEEYGEDEYIYMKLDINKFSHMKYNFKNI